MVGYYITGKELVTRLLLGIIGILYIILTAGGIAEFLTLLSNHLFAAFAGGLATIGLYYFFEWTTLGVEINEYIQDLGSLAIIALIVLTLIISALIIQIVKIGRSSVMAATVGLCTMLLLISSALYLWRR